MQTGSVEHNEEHFVSAKGREYLVGYIGKQTPKLQSYKYIYTLFFFVSLFPRSKSF